MKVVTIGKVFKDKLEGPHGNYQGKKLPVACTQGPGGRGGRERGWQPPVSAVSTQCFDETKHTEEGTASAEKALRVHVLELQDTAPSRG